MSQQVRSALLSAAIRNAQDLEEGKRTQAVWYGAVQVAVEAVGCRWQLPEGLSASEKPWHTPRTK